jgi:hypothetical protein
VGHIATGQSAPRRQRIAGTLASVQVALPGFLAALAQLSRHFFYNRIHNSVPVNAVHFEWR